MADPTTRSLAYYQVDAFARRAFEGNPAGVCLLDSKLDDAVMQRIAAEQKFSETAFVLPLKDESEWRLRWFTPACEVELCGHATLAAGFVLMQELDLDEVRFLTKSGPLDVWREGEEFVLELPAHKPTAWGGETAAQTLTSLGLPTDTPAFQHGDNQLFVVEDESAVRAVRPNFASLSESAPHLAIVTAPDDSGGFVSRVFAPAVGVDEDPVTGSAHCILAPFWQERLGASPLRARQLSERGGELQCQVKEDRVALCSAATLVLQGTMYV